MAKRISKQNTALEQPEQVAPSEETPHAFASPHYAASSPALIACFNALLQTTPDALIALDENYQVFNFNPSTSKMLGFSYEEAVGRSCTDVLRCRNLNKTVLCNTSSCPLKRVLSKKQALPNEELLLGTRQEHCQEVSASVTPISLGEKQLVVFNARDVSALKVANQVRSNFISMVSHELRTPLNSVHGFIDLLLHDHMGALTPEQHVYLGYTQEGVNQLISIVEDILFMTRSDLGQFVIKQDEVPFQTLVRQVVSSLQPQAQKAEVVVLSEVSASLPSLHIDAQKIIQVLNNLVANAIKFTPPGGTVTIEAYKQDEKSVKVLVADTGYGIPLEDQQHVFERFYQSNHMQQSKMGGYGLGLAIAKLIVEQHGGTIGFNTILDEGTTFSFTLPIHVKERKKRK